MFESVLTKKVLGCNNKIFQTNKWMFFLAIQVILKRSKLLIMGIILLNQEGIN